MSSSTTRKKAEPPRYCAAKLLHSKSASVITARGAGRRVWLCAVRCAALACCCPRPYRDHVAAGLLSLLPAAAVRCKCWPLLPLLCCAAAHSFRVSGWVGCRVVAPAAPAAAEELSPREEGPLTLKDLSTSTSSVCAASLSSTGALILERAIKSEMRTYHQFKASGQQFEVI